jgi:hypothetical protein
MRLLEHPSGSRPADDHQPDDIVAVMRSCQTSLVPFHPDVVAFAEDLSRSLRRWSTTGRDPAVAALAYWIRPARVEQLRTDWLAETSEEGLSHQPRGVVFHIPPTNVDTLFVYSWLLAALMGNANIIRISPSARGAVGPLLDEIDVVTRRHPLVGHSTVFLSYGRDPLITEALSKADVRVIWGGDETVAAIRSIPCGPRTLDLAFADRFSYALLDAEAVLGTVDITLLVRQFYNDAYWFDQLGCASPRATIWRGDAATVETASNRFWLALVDELESRDHETPDGAVLSKLLHLDETAMTGSLVRVQRLAPGLAVGDLADRAELPRSGPGGGLFYSRRVQSLKDVVELVNSRDQTLTYYGIANSELTELAGLLGSRGIDRIVPIGSALDFDRYWDGHDLLRAFTRTVRIMR